MTIIKPVNKPFNTSRTKSVRLTSYKVTFSTKDLKAEEAMVQALNPQQARTLARMIGDDKGWEILTIEKKR